MRSHRSHRIRPNNPNYVGEASGRSAKTPRSYEFATTVHQKGQLAETSPAEAAPSIRQLKSPPFAEDKPRPNTVARSFERMWRPLCHHARMGIVLSHTTARAVYQTADLNLSELVEYYFEICGSYALETSDDIQYRERPALTSVEELRAFFSEASGYRGSNKALKALSYVREGCRSPLETAFVMMLTMPKSMGGLAIRAIKTDYPIPVPKRYAALTRRTVFYLDALLENSMTDIEYNGFYHDEPEQQSIDEERRNTLRNMGYAVITVSRHSFFKQSAFRRIMEAIRIREKIWPGRLPDNFAILQETLRQFVLRRYFEYGRRVLEALKEEEATKCEIASQYPQADDPSINDVPEPDDMQHVGALAEEINGPWECNMSAKIDENRTEDDTIIDLIENSLF